MNNKITETRITRYFADGTKEEVNDPVAREVDSQIRLEGEFVYQTASTPEDMLELAAGYCYIEKRIIIDFDRSEVKVYDNDVCSINCLIAKTIYPAKKTASVSPLAAGNMCAELLETSETFKQTGNMHCVALCKGEEVKYIGEDISRHNAIYKAVGTAIRAGVNPADYYIITTARVPFSMAQMADKAGIACIVSKSAPTDRAIKYAKDHGMKIMGFASERRVNVYE